MNATMLYRDAMAAAVILIGMFCSNATAQDRFGASDSRMRDAAGASSGATWQGSDWLGSSLERRQWRLGVEGTDTEVGVVIRSVVPRSAAEQARMEVGDAIIAVEGYQVGKVGDRLYSLQDELNRRADASGLVALLVQDHRTGRLATLRVRMDGSQNSLTGTLIYTGRTSLPADAIVTVQIENVSRPFYVVRNGQTSFRPTSPSNIPFQLSYDPTYIEANDVYRVRAFVTSSGRTILETATPQNVLTQGNPSDVRMNLTPLSQNTLVSAAGSSVVSAGYPSYNGVDQEITAMYLKYLGRQPSTLELAALRSTPGIELRLKTMPQELMAAQEYFDLVGNNNLAWLDRVFQEIVKKRPSQIELDQWMRRYAEVRYSRTELLRQLTQQSGR